MDAVSTAAEPVRWEVYRCPQCKGVTSITKSVVAQAARYCPNCIVPMGEPFEVVRAVGARRSDPDTSKLAALKNEPRRGSQRARILEAIRLSGARGLTAREAERRSGVGEAHKRVSELKQGGHIVAQGTRADEQTGAEGEVFVAMAALSRPSHFDPED